MGIVEDHHRRLLGDLEPILSAQLEAAESPVAWAYLLEVPPETTEQAVTKGILKLVELTVLGGAATTRNPTRTYYVMGLTTRRLIVVRCRREVSLSAGASVAVTGVATYPRPSLPTLERRAGAFGAPIVVVHDIVEPYRLLLPVPRDPAHAQVEALFEAIRGARS